ncbi:MAG: TatD family hydrolase [Acidobacteriota bacterium]|nr:TatD family hydrolase [Acidobacteriota bacterium]
MTASLWDMHVHLDLMRDARGVAREAERVGLGMLAVTVTPDGYERAAKALSGRANVRVGVGLHPWWVADGRCGAGDVARAAELARRARFVGEVGLDLSGSHVPDGSLDVQVAAFEVVADACAETSDVRAPKVLSLHSVRAADITLDVLERTGCLASCACVFHWFSGTGDELHRAVRAGCHFSVNEMMLRTRRGREYARQLPAERLLLETDLPPGEDASCTARDILASLERTAGQLGTIRGTDMRAVTRDNAERLLGR